MEPKMSSNYVVIRRAMLARKPISFDYKNHRRVACPHVLGTKGGLEKVLTYQYGGGSSSGLPPGGEWRCLFLSDAYNIQIIEGGWHTGLSHTRPQTCVDMIDVQVFVDGSGNPYTQEA
jgi:hypothetical protein